MPQDRINAILAHLRINKVHPTPMTCYNLCDTLGKTSGIFLTEDLIQVLKKENGDYKGIAEMKATKNMNNYT